jgi:glycosyltransferase involved in cell wall biosynthesis
MHDRPKYSREQILDAVVAIEKRLGRIENLLLAERRISFRSKAQAVLVKLGTFEQYHPREIRFSSPRVPKVAAADLPSIQIVTPSLNQARFVGETIESVLGQNYPRLTYIIQDCLSDDGTEEILEGYKDRVVVRRERDTGQANAINRGFENADSDIMGYLNSDDLLLPGTLAYVAEFFLRNPEIDVVYGHRVVIDDQTFEIGRWILPAHDSEAVKWADYIPQETMFWRKRVWDRVAKFDESFRYALDWDFILRAQALDFKFKRLPRFLGCFRVHDAQKTSSLLDVGADEMRRLRVRHLGRKYYVRPVRQAIRGYVLQHVLLNLLYRLRILRY